MSIELTEKEIEFLKNLLGSLSLKPLDDGADEAVLRIRSISDKISKPKEDHA